MTEPRHALVVDDEHDIRELLGLTLGRMGLRVQAAADLAQARNALAQRSFDLCITDMRLPDGNGLTLVEYIATRHPQIPVAMITAHGNVDAAVAALKAGAFDFVSKPVELAVLRRMVGHALELNERRQAPGPTTSRLIGQSAAMRMLRETIGKVSRSQAPVLIVGESGVGKELVARSIHQCSPRKEGPFVPVNCGAIPADLIESELFGHRKGSFTGAHADKEGLFQAAEGGTLFLDEIAELPLHLQVKLLRVIQEKAVRPVGAQVELPVDVRILSATHKRLDELVDAGRFRHDLYYRINVIALPVPPLRDRREDIVPMAETLLQRLGAEQGLKPFHLTPEACEALSAYHFPGNVRELENVLERATALADGPRLDVADLRLPDAPVAVSPSKAAGPVPALHRLAVESDAALPAALEAAERDAILKALDAHRWNRTRTAAALGITFRALRYKLKKLGID